jgi:hypothetical protein
MEKRIRISDRIPDTAICFWREGVQWCCAFGDFISEQQSPIGYGETFDAAMEALRIDQQGRGQGIRPTP